MYYTAIITKEGRQTLADFPGCPGCQTFADPGEEIGERAAEALMGWLEAHLVSGQAPPEPKTVRTKGRARALQVPVPAKLAVKLALRWARLRAGLTQAELARRAGLSQPAVATRSSMSSGHGFGRTPGSRSTGCLTEPAAGNHRSGRV